MGKADSEVRGCEMAYFNHFLLSLICFLVGYEMGKRNRE
nr:MAG TPA: hypothetical protein [Caudoviricetes sp.]